MRPIEIKNEYFAYLIGLGGSADASAFFSDSDLLYTPAADEFFTGMIINPYSMSEYKSFETHVLLGAWIAEALEIDFDHFYPYKDEKLNLIYLKSTYEDVKKSVIEEIKRIYQETQSFLNERFPNTESIKLVRTLNHMQDEQFKKGQEVKFNFITSYCPTYSHSYPGNREVVCNQIKKKNIFSYINLSYQGQTLGDLENEVIVIHSDQL